MAKAKKPKKLKTEPCPRCGTEVAEGQTCHECNCLGVKDD